MYHIYTVCMNACMHVCIPMTSQLCNSLPSYHGSGLPGKWSLLGPMSEVGKNGYGPGSKWSIPPNHSISFNDTKWRISSWNIGTTLLDPQMFAIVPSPPTGGRPGLIGPEAWTKSSPSTAPTTWSPESAWWNRGTWKRQWNEVGYSSSHPVLLVSSTFGGNHNLCIHLTSYR